MEQRILHIDMDAFFASVEEVRDPSLKGKPLIIGGDDRDSRGVVSTASYAAREYGVHSAMPLVQARRLCPHGIFLRGSYSLYQAASEKVMSILETVSPLVECVSIDEAYIDISGSLRLFGGEDAIARYLKTRIREETQLPCTVAIGANKLVAKVGSDRGKPDGYLNIPTAGEADFLRPLEVHRLPGVGPRTNEVLAAMGVKTVGQLADLPVAKLLNMFGQNGFSLQRAAMGISTSPVEPDVLPKSVGRETTFERDLLDWDRIEQVLMYLMERACHALREKGMETRCVTLKVRYSDFTTNTFSMTLAEPTTLDAEVMAALHVLLPKAKERHSRVRLIGVSLSSLLYNQHQLRLFERQNHTKWEKAMESVDHIRERYGFSCVRLGRSIQLGKDVKLATPSLSR